MKIMNKKSKYRSIRVSGDVFFTVLVSIVLIGAFIGSLYYREISAIDFVETFSIADSFYIDIKPISFWGCFLNSIFKNTILIAIIFMSGMCSIGHPMCILILFYKGIDVGVLISAVYSYPNITNWFPTLLHIIMDAVVSTFVLVLASKEGMRLSNKYFKLMVGGKIEDDFNQNIRLYLLKFAILFAIIILLSLFQSIFLILIG